MGFFGVGQRAIGSRHLRDYSVVNRTIGSDAITTPKIAPETIIGIDIAPGAIGSSELLNASVISTKISDDAVGSNNISISAISYETQVKANVIGFGRLTTGLQGSLGIGAIGVGSIEMDKLQLRFEHGRIGTINAYLERRVLVGSFDAPTPNPYGLAFANDKGRLWLYEMTSHYLFEMGTTTGNIVGSHNTIADMVDLAFNSDNNTLWASEINKKYLYEIGTTNGVAVGSLKWNVLNPLGIAYVTDKHRLWVANSNNYIFEVGTTTGNIIGSFKPYKQTTLSSMVGMTFDTNGNVLWVSDTTGAQIYGIGTAVHNVIGSFASPSTAPYGVAFSEDHKRLWNVDKNSDYIYQTGTAYPLLGTYAHFTSPFAVKPDVAAVAIGSNSQIFTREPSLGSVNIRAGTLHPAKAMWMAWGSR